MDAPPLRAFRVAVYRYNADPQVDDPETSIMGTTDWEAGAILHPPGFTSTCSVHLHDTWDAIFRARLTHYDGFVMGYEHIVKFGAAMDWTQKFRVIIDVEYAGC